jgi:hypothetical protein
MFAGHSSVKVLRDQVASGGFPASTYFTADANYMIFLVPKVVSYGTVGRVLIGKRVVLQINFIGGGATGFGCSGVSYIKTGESLSFENTSMTFDLFLFSLNNYI